VLSCSLPFSGWRYSISVAEVSGYLQCYKCIVRKAVLFLLRRCILSGCMWLTKLFPVIFTTLLALGVQILWWVHLFVCLSVCLQGYLGNHTHDLCQICCACCLWLWRRCDTLCTSGFVNDIMFFFCNGPYSGTNFVTKDRFWLSLHIYCKVRQNSMSCYQMA